MPRSAAPIRSSGGNRRPSGNDVSRRVSGGGRKHGFLVADHFGRRRRSLRADDVSTLVDSNMPPEPSRGIMAPYRLAALGEEHASNAMVMVAPDAGSRSTLPSICRRRYGDRASSGMTWKPPRSVGIGPNYHAAIRRLTPLFSSRHQVIGIAGWFAPVADGIVAQLRCRLLNSGVSTSPCAVAPARTNASVAAGS